MTDRALMQQAVEALEHGGPAHRLHAIHNLRAALAEPESDEWMSCPWCGEMKPRAALAEPAQEPVAPARRPLTPAQEAAPELLEALRDALELIETICPIEGHVVRAARATIVKAEESHE